MADSDAIGRRPDWIEGLGLSNVAESRISEGMKVLTTHVPTVALLGKTGAGKSSLGNALFGAYVFSVSAVNAGTRIPTPLSAAILGVDIQLVDFPGVGESADRDDEYRELYRQWIDKIDVALWVIKMDDRVLAPDLDYFTNVIRPSAFPMERVVFVITQADKADPLREWDIDAHKPSIRQAANISEKISQLRETFSIAPSQVVPVSAEERYNLQTLAEKIIAACPDKAVLNVARALENDLKTEVVRNTVFKKVISFLKSFYNDNSEEINKAVFSFVAAAIKKIRK